MTNKHTPGRVRRSIHYNHELGVCHVRSKAGNIMGGFVEFCHDARYHATSISYDRSGFKMNGRRMRLLVSRPALMDDFGNLFAIAKAKGTQS